MANWQLATCLIMMAWGALWMLCYPLRRTLNKSYFITLPILSIALFFAYVIWGGWIPLQTFYQEDLKRQQAEALLSTMKSPDELSEKLRAKLDDSPKSAHGWYLLGRLYAGQNKWPEARDAFLKAHQLDKKDEATTVHYALSLWQVNNQAFNESIRDMFKQVLKNTPNQPDALAMLAMDAFKNKHYEEAASYWQQLLSLVPEGSDEANALRKAIAKAKDSL